MTTQEHKTKLDKILKHTKFDSRTKALWAYYRGNRSVNMFWENGKSDKVMNIIVTNLHLNGSACYFPCECRARCYHRNRCAVKIRVRPTTYTHWEYAVKLIDIALGK